MKTKLGYTATALLSLVLCAVLLCGAVLPAMAEEVDLPSLDYSNPNIESTASLSAYELYTALLDNTPTAGETLYWQQSALTLKYTSLIPADCIDTQYDGDRGVLDITLLPYTYFAKNESNVTWIPQKLLLGGKTYELTAQDGVYKAHIENCFYSGDFDMQVDYVCQIQIPREVISVLRNEAYQKGEDAFVLVSDYRKKLLKYESLVEKKNKWDAYVKWEEDYSNYLIEKEIYAQLKKEYDAYMVEYNKYQSVIDAQNQWLDYFAQQEAYPQKQQAYAEYVKYERVYQAALDKLSMFEAIFKKESRGWSMYADIMGNAVTEVLSKQDLLATSGCNPDDIYLAGTATENLRVLLKGYADLRNEKWKSDYEKYKALYTYYTQNYDALCQNFCDLYKTLKGLYENTAVSNFIGLKNKTAHYQQLVGHLFVISTALDQSSERNESIWRIDNKKLRDVIEDVHYFPDGDWHPQSTPYPETEVKRVERPTEPVEPSVELPTFIPELPPVVENPGDPPAVVEDPSGTPRPEEPEPVGEKPEPPVLDPISDLLWQEVESGELQKFTQRIYPETLVLISRVERQISIQNFKTVTLYHPDGSVFQKYTVDYGEGMKLDPYPFAESPAYTYEWLRWVRSLPNGETVAADVSCVTENISLYPHYNAIPKIYYITWTVEGVSTRVPYYYGAMPNGEKYVRQFPYETQDRRYVFLGWDSEIVPVTGDAEYVAKIDNSLKKFNVTWVTKNGAESITEEWEYNETPKFKADPYTDSYYQYMFVRWDKEPSPVTSNVTYTAVYKKTPWASGGLNEPMEIIQGETDITVIATKNSIKLRQAAILADETGKTLTVSWEGKLSASLSGEELKRYIAGGSPTFYLYSLQDGDTVTYQFEYPTFGSAGASLPQFDIHLVGVKEHGKETVFDVKTKDGWVRLPDRTYVANGSFEVRCQYAYSIIPTANKFCNVMQMTSKAVPGEQISLKLNCIYGYKVTGATVTDAEGNEIPVEGLSFQMPASVVNVVLEVERIVYRVTFLVDGEVWHYAEYFAGDEIVLPENPPKRTEGDYTFTFTGWGDVPAIVMGEDEELVFEASFSQALIIDDYDTGHNNDVVFTIILPIAGAVLVLVIAFLIVNRVVRKKGGWRLLKIKIMKKFASSKKTKSKDEPKKDEKAKDEPKKNEKE